MCELFNKRGVGLRSLFKLAVLVVFFSASGLYAQDNNAVGGPFSGWPSANNLADVVLQLVSYHDFGQYDYEIRQVSTAGADYLEKRVCEAKKGERMAAVFDIDETALSNWAVMSDCGFCAYKIQAKDYPNAKDPAIIPVLELYKLPRKLGVKTYFITGRLESQRELTSKNLKGIGYDGWEELVMRPDNNTDPARVFKSDRRQAIVDKGYAIVINIGDQASDLAGCCSERSFKLPNPFYLVP
jgi:acid phosphatase